MVLIESQTAKKLNKNMQYTLVTKKDEEVYKVRTHKKKRFLKILRSINWHRNDLKAYLRISYGKSTDISGKLVNFYNDGVYENKKDLWLAFRAFIEN